MVRKRRHGIGWTAFTYVMAYGYKKSPAEDSFQKLPEVKRAAKKAERLADKRYHEA
jgi:hypothetical protein